MLDVGLDFGGRQGRDRKAESDALFELPQILTVQDIAQLWLPDQNNLQKFLVREFKVAPEADFFQDFRAELVGLIDDQGGDFPSRCHSISSF